LKKRGVFEVAFGTAFDALSRSPILSAKMQHYCEYFTTRVPCFHLFHFFGNHAKVDSLRLLCLGFARFWNMEDFRLAGSSGEALRLGSPWLGHIKLSLVNHPNRATRNWPG